MQNNSLSQKSPHAIALIGWAIVGLGMIFYCYEYLLRIVPSAMIHQLMQAFGLSAQGFGLMMGLYYVAYTPMQAVVGIIYDIYGPRRILTSAALLCVFGSYLFTKTDNTTLASIGRFIVGFGSAFGFVGGLKLASVWLPLNRFALGAGFITASGMLAGMVGNMGMSYMVDHIGWQSTLMITTIIGLVLIPMMWFFVPDHSPYHMTSTAPRLSYKETFINLGKIIKNSQMLISGIIGAVLYLSLSVFAELWGNEYISKVYGFDHSQASLINSMVFFGWLIGSPITGWISDRIRQRRSLLMVGCFVAGFLSLIIVFVTQLPLSVWCVIFLLFGIFCSTENITFVVGRENSHPALAGSAVSYINMLIMLSGMIFQPFVGKLLDMNWTGAIENGVRIYSPHNYQLAFLILPIGLFVGGLLTLKLKETHADQVHL